LSLATVLVPQITSAQENLLKNPGFEENDGIGAVPRDWQYIDENFEYWGWVAPRTESEIGGIVPRSGRFMAGLDTEMLGVDTNGSDYLIVRSGLYQTITVPGKCRGTFSIYYNDMWSTALSHVACIRLACTIDNTDIRSIKTPLPNDNRKRGKQQPALGWWSKSHYRVAQHLPHSQTAIGDWTLATLPVVIDTDRKEVQLTLWIGIFENQSGTEVGYYRIDDASFVLDATQTQPAP
jgi:hypothetical protein